MERQFNANIEITHDDCGHTQPVDVIGLTDETDITCAGCGEVFRLDWEVVEKIDEDFVEMLDGQLTDAGLDIEDGRFLRFARLYGRIPQTPEDIRKLDEIG